MSKVISGKTGNPVKYTTVKKYTTKTGKVVGTHKRSNPSK